MILLFTATCYLFVIFNWKVCMLINIELYMYIECYLCTHIFKIRLKIISISDFGYCD